MKVVLYMALSASGHIAGSKNETPWSEAEWNSYAEAVKECKAIIIGRKTYELMKKEGEFAKISNPRTVVISKKIEAHKSENFTFVNSPEEAVQLLENEGFKQVLIGGGAKTNSAFVKANLVDEIYLDIEPHLFGEGVNLFEKENFTRGLKLMGTKLLSKDEIQLHYKVIK